MNSTWGATQSRPTLAPNSTRVLRNWTPIAHTRRPCSFLAANAAWGPRTGGTSFALLASRPRVLWVPATVLWVLAHSTVARGPQYSGAAKVTRPRPTLTSNAATVLVGGIQISRTRSTGNFLAEYVASRSPPTDGLLDSSLRAPVWLPQYCGSVSFRQSLTHHALAGPAAEAHREGPSQACPRVELFGPKCTPLHTTSRYPVREFSGCTPTFYVESKAPFRRGTLGGLLPWRFLLSQYRAFAHG